LEQEIQVLGEENKDVITYSKSLPIILSRSCRNDCPYCGFHRKDNITVPYSTIKLVKAARANGVREGLYIAGERPDRLSEIRATLDLWGFNSYVDYLYTLCELGFLEGLIPVVDVGFLSPVELKKMSEICALGRITLDSVDKKMQASMYDKSPGKKLELRVKSLIWAGKLHFPVISGFVVGLGESFEYRKEMLHILANLHKEYGHIHEVCLHNFVPTKGTAFGDKAPPSEEEMLRVVEAALEIMPSDVKVTIPLELNPNVESFVKAGIRDFGRIFEMARKVYPYSNSVNINDVEQRVQALGFSLQQRFPIGMAWIKQGAYSRKLGQVFDAYKYKIKKNEQEKLKEHK
jgi:7,8-didemethyl-8-hydroxy-5-deazariboflavin synthase CofG subunit